MTRLKGEGIDPQQAEQLASKRKHVTERIDTLNGFVSAMESGKDEAVDLEAAARGAAEEELKKKRMGNCAEYTKLAMTVLKNTIAGVLTIYLYFMDLISDYQVTSTTRSPSLS